jgi:type I restriction enzyme S subunit
MNTGPKEIEIDGLPDLPEGWAWVRFGILIGELRNGISTKPELSQPGFPILRISAVRSGSVSLNEHRFLPRGADLLAEYGLRDGDLLFTRYNGNLELLGVCGMVRGLGTGPLLYPDKLMRVRFDHGHVLPAYAELFFQSAGARDRLTTQSRSSAGQQGISGGDIKNQPFALPPFREQQRLVKAIEAARFRIDAACDHLSVVPAILTRFRQSVLSSACSGQLTEEWREKQAPLESSADLLARVLAERNREFETQCAKANTRGQRIPPQPNNLEQLEYSLPEPLVLPEIPEEWTWVSVNDVISVAQYGTSVRADGTSGRGVPLLRMGNIQDGRLDLADLQYIMRQSENVPEFRVAKGDVLFNRTNSPELVGKTAVYDSELEAVFASYLIRVRCDARIAVGDYLSSWLNSPWGRWWARTVRTDGVSQSNINASKLRTMPMPLPPLQEQAEIIRRIGTLFALAAKIEQSVQAAHRRTEKLSQAIFAKAFRGELVPTESDLARREGRDYEPASVLLERIRAERNSEANSPPVPKRKLKKSTALVGA